MSITPEKLPPRVDSLDAYRGVVMFLMMAEVLRLREVARALPDSAFWKFLALHQTHVDWEGLTLHDLRRNEEALAALIARERDLMALEGGA